MHFRLTQSLGKYSKNSIPVLRKKSAHREFIVTNSHETHSCSSQHTRGMLPAP